jgi:hypothetical protein
MNANSTWRLEGARAEGAAVFQSCDGSFGFRVNLLRPDLGMHGIAIGGTTFPHWRLLGPQLSSPQNAPLVLADAYTRGADLIATYTQDDEKLRRQIYWRDLQPTREGGRPGVELIVSVQTSLLHGEPRLEIASSFGPGELFMRRPDGGLESLASDETVRCAAGECAGVFLLRPAGTDFSYVEMVHPSDFQGAELVFTAVGAVIRHSLFPEPLEKGVIRRGRVRGWFVKRNGDAASATELHQAWLAEPPPLTT